MRFRLKKRQEEASQLDTPTEAEGDEGGSEDEAAQGAESSDPNTCDSMGSSASSC